MFARALLAVFVLAGPALPVRPARAGACDAPGRAVERALGIPPDLLGAIGRVESGRRDNDGRRAA